MFTRIQGVLIQLTNVTSVSVVGQSLNVGFVHKGTEQIVFDTTEAAQAALEMGAPSYRFLRRYLERRPPVPLSLRQVDPLIRQLSLYRDLIDQRTGDPT